MSISFKSHFIAQHLYDYRKCYRLYILKKKMVIAIYECEYDDRFGNIYQNISTYFNLRKCTNN